MDVINIGHASNEADNPESPEVDGNAEERVGSHTPVKFELPSLGHNADVSAEGGDLVDAGDVESSPNDAEDKLVLPSVEETALDGSDVRGRGQEIKSNGYAESIILDGDEEQENAAEFFLPRIEFNPLPTITGGGAQPDVGLPTWNNDFESTVLCRKPRKEIVAENAHPKCFGSVGASGLSRIFTSGSYCPDMSSRSMAPKNIFNCPSVPPLDVRNADMMMGSERIKPMEMRSKTIALIPRSKKESLKMPEIRTSKVSLFSRDGEQPRNMVFVRNARMTRDDRAKSDLEVTGPRRLEKPSGIGGMPRLAERDGPANLRNARDAAAKRSKAAGKRSVKVAESESDELTPSEAGIMGMKINDWFTSDRRKEDPKPKAHHNVRNKRQSRNIWDPGIGNRIHRGLASSVFKSNACIGNYLNDVTASRFPQVEIRQIVFTR